MGSSAKRRPRGWCRSARASAKPLGGPTVIVNPTGASEVARTEQETGGSEERLRDALLLDGALQAYQDMKNVLMHEGVLAEPVRRELRFAADNLLIARTRPVVESYLSERLGCVVTLDSLAELLDGMSDVVEGSGELLNLGVNGAVLQARSDALPGGGIADSVLDGGAAGGHDASPSLGGGAHSVGAGGAAGASVCEVPAVDPSVLADATAEQLAAMSSERRKPVA